MNAENGVAKNQRDQLEIALSALQVAIAALEKANLPLACAYAEMASDLAKKQGEAKNP